MRATRARVSAPKRELLLPCFLTVQISSLTLLNSTTNEWCFYPGKTLGCVFDCTILVQVLEKLRKAKIQASHLAAFAQSPPLMLPVSTIASAQASQKGRKKHSRQSSNYSIMPLATHPNATAPFTCYMLLRCNLSLRARVRATALSPSCFSDRRIILGHHRHWRCLLS